MIDLWSWLSPCFLQKARVAWKQDTQSVSAICSGVIIKNTNKTLIKKIIVFDIYTGKNIPKGKKSKNIDGGYDQVNVFESVKAEFEAIAGIVEESGTWTEVK